MFELFIFLLRSTPMIIELGSPERSRRVEMWKSARALELLSDLYANIKNMSLVPK